MYVRAYYDRERTSARSRREKAEQLAQDERQKQRKKANEMRCVRRAAPAASTAAMPITTMHIQAEAATAAALDRGKGCQVGGAARVNHGKP